LNSPQPNGGAVKNENMAQPQQYIPPMVRAPIPGHIREQLRPSMPYEPQPAAPRSNTTQQGRVTQQSPRGSFRKPQPNYQTALSELQQTVQDQYTPPSQPQLQYAQRQTHVAEYGRVPPTITAPPTADITTVDPFRMQQFSRSVLANHQAAPSPTWTRNILTLHIGVEAIGRGTPAHLPGRRAMAASEQSSLSLTQQAEDMAFDMNKRTGLNRFGAPYGYMPANFVDKIPGAWDMEGTLKWVPSWMREER
jgi:hypothetical protein